MAIGIAIPSDVNVAETLQHEVLVRQINAAGGALWAYDVLLNLDIEITHVWASLDPQRRPFRLTTAIFNLLYLAQRYLPLLDRVILDQYFMLGAQGARACMITYNLSAWLSIFGILLSELMLALRIWAVWAGKPSIAVIIVVFTSACAAPAMTFFAKFMRGMQYPELNASGSADLKRCFYLMENRDIYICWILLLAYDIASFILIAIPGVGAYRTGGRSNLMKVVYRDGVIYYALISLVSLVNVIIILVLPHDLVLLISAFERVLHSVLASHAILQIREVASKNVIQDRSLSGTGELDSEYTEMSFFSNTLHSRSEQETGSGNMNGNG